jgi:hypothetical protein
MIPAIRRSEFRHTCSTIVHAVTPLLAGMLLAAVVPSSARAQARDADDPFARHGWNLELGGHVALETWNYNISHEEVYGLCAGLTYGLGNGITLKTSWPLYYASQRGTNAYLLGTTIGVRARIYRRGRVSVFLEGDVGVSEADTFVPPRGTRFNYLALGGAGFTVRLRPGVHLLAGLKLLHLSNNSLAGRGRNPDIEAVGPHAAILLRF